MVYTDASNMLSSRPK